MFFLNIFYATLSVKDFFFFFQVSLDSRVREIVNQNMVDPNARTFDEAQLQIYTLMKRDSYPRFLASPVYKKLLDSLNDKKSPDSSKDWGGTCDVVCSMQLPPCVENVINMALS